MPASPSAAQRERERVEQASKICPCGKDATDMLQPGVGSCSICHQRTCCATCANRHHYTAHEQSERGRKFLVVNGFDDVQYAGAQAKKGKR